VQLSPDIGREIWQKFAFLVSLSGTTTTIRQPIAPVRANEQTRVFLVDVTREVMALARGQGMDLPADYAEQRLMLGDDVAYDMTSSMYHDLVVEIPLRCAGCQAAWSWAQSSECRRPSIAPLPTFSPCKGPAIASK
jgi:2-dehydropantoate 2-reductase